MMWPALALGKWGRRALAATGVVVLGAGLFLAGRCSDGDEPDADERPPAVISGSSVIELVKDEGPASRLNPFEGQVQPDRVGRSDPLPVSSPARQQQRRFVSDAVRADSTVTLPDDLELAPAESLPAPDAPGLLPHATFSRKGDRASISALDSRGAYQRAEFPCDEGRDFEGGTRIDGSGFYGNCQRALPSLFPKIVKTIGVGLACAGAGYAIAAVADYEHPEYVAAGAGTGCAIISYTGG